MEQKTERPELWTMFRDFAASTNGFAHADGEAVLGQFRADLTGNCARMSDLPNRMRWLHYERGELMTLLHHLLVTGRLNGLHALIVKAVDAIDLELHIAEKQWEYPELTAIASYPIKNNRPTLLLVKKHRTLGVMGMARILTALELMDGMVSSDRKEPTTTSYAEVFETGFGFSFNSIHDRQYELFSGSLGNAVSTLEAMITALTKEFRRRAAAKAAKQEESGGKK